MNLEALDALTSFALSAILAAASPSDEPEDVARARLAAIAADIVAVAAEDSPSDAETIRRAAVLLAIGRHESGWRAEVGDGRVRGDFGRSCGYHQIHAGRARCKELLADQRLAFSTALGLVLATEHMCRRQHGRHARLRAYASGSCSRGAKESRRMSAWWDEYAHGAAAAVREVGK